VTLGIRVTGPATDYGYLVPDLGRGGAGRLMARPLRQFEEKPDREMAARLAVQPGIAWNAGIFLWQRGAIRAALRDFAPDVFEAVEAAHAAGRLQEAYPAIRSISIDYAVMEPAARAARVVNGRHGRGLERPGDMDGVARRARRPRVRIGGRVGRLVHGAARRPRCRGRGSLVDRPTRRRPGGRQTFRPLHSCAERGTPSPSSRPC